jgi:hypothetical protein
LVLVLSATAEARGKGDLMEIARDHLVQTAPSMGLSQEDFQDLVTTDSYRTHHNGVSHLYLRQRLNGIEVANGNLNFAIDANGRVVHVAGRFVPNLKGSINTERPQIGREAAIRQAAEKLGLELTEPLQVLEDNGGPTRETIYSGGGISLDPIPMKLAFHATPEGTVRLTWEMVIRQIDQRHWWSLWLDAVDGEIVKRADWIAYDSYRVFALPKESPSDGPRTDEVDPADAVASPFDWHDTNGAAGAEFTTTRGNNVCAQTDSAGFNLPCGAGFQPDGGTSLDFLFGLDLNTQEPPDYRAAAVTNLFYWNNILHDVLYQYGFDEPAGNFQENNYGNGGAGSDSVNADAQDGSGTNNANFGTPPDGQNPRMQMFIWTAPPELTVNSPGSIAGSYAAAGAEFGAELDAIGVTGDVELVDDGSGSGSEGCGSLVGFTAGRIAMIDRGSCEFGTKVLNAENAGAIAAIVVNNQGDGLVGMGAGAQGGLVTIPSLFIGQSDGDTIKAELPGVNATLSSAGLDRDSDLDSGIVAHEYCHGLSIRLTGGPNNVSCLSGSQQAGEGWSDICTLFLTPDAADTATTPRGVGTYAVFQPVDGAGIRPFPYTTDMAANPLTYGELSAGTLSIPHGIGTVWATAVWEMYWNLVDEYGFDPDLYSGTGGNNLAMQLVIDGLKLQPCDPTFLDARDAILAADAASNGGANFCHIWEAFAKRGMGLNAADGGSSSSLNVTEDFTLPAACSNRAPEVSLTAPGNNSVFDVSASINFAGSADDEEDGDLSGSLAWTSNLDGTIGNGGSFSTTLSAGNHTINASVTDSGGLSDVEQITVAVVDPPGCPENAEVTDVVGTETKRAVRKVTLKSGLTVEAGDNLTAVAGESIVVEAPVTIAGPLTLDTRANACD